MKRQAAALVAVVLAGCSRPTPPPDNSAALAALSARLAALEGRVTAVEAQAGRAEAATSQPALPAAPKAELRVLDGFNSPAHTYPSMDACMKAKAVIEGQSAQREAEARARGELLNAEAASCLPL